MMKRRMLVLTLALSCPAQAGMTPADAFSDGQAFGNANLGTAKAKINSTEAGTGVPNYTASDPASGHYMGGTGSLNAPATMDVQGCTSTPGTADPDAHTHGKCEGVRMLMDDPGKKNVMFPLNPKTDPVTVRRDLVAGDAETYLGSLIVSGAYSGCATKTVQDPDTYQTETCNQYLTAGEESCQEILSVTISTSESCVPGTWYGGFMMSDLHRIDVFCDMNRSDGMLALRFTPTSLHGACAIGYLDVPRAQFTVSDRVQWGVTGTGCCDGEGNSYTTYGYTNHELTSIHHWKGSCTVTNYIGYEPGYVQGCAGDTCSYTFRMIDSRWGNQHVASAGSFTLPKIIVTETDVWDNQCGPLEARLP